MRRNYFARALYGGRVSLTVGFLSMIISTIIGTIVGTVSGYFGGRVDSLIMRTIDILMSIPTFFDTHIKCLFKTRNSKHYHNNRPIQLDWDSNNCKSRNPIC